MEKHALVVKSTGRIDQAHPYILWDSIEIPINEDELAYVKITQEMDNHLQLHDKVLDYNLSYYNFSTNEWILVWNEPEKVNIYNDRLSDLNRLIEEAERKLSVSDASPKFIDKVNNYIEELEAIVITNEEIQSIEWPLKPW